MTRWLIALAAFSAAVALYALGCWLRNIFTFFAITDAERDLEAGRVPALASQHPNQLAQFQHRDSPFGSGVSARDDQQSSGNHAAAFPYVIRGS